ncbi:outer membrane beta-barrel protein [Muricauda sp. CAU 1633]|uniref:outer membrane beta-barrel protein n=1 Tax=Allomuricauda sp. CAU 1633 TaxID=2816036 RepID=UPI001A9011EA|nr:outer membrane beta-barrel protein [Muricauda sp. CAU 1633]MBO0321359.1 outer membrane beta-barrel protein [Muricauda sp. CAU 1633]
MKHVLLFTLLLGAVTLQAQDSENSKKTIPKGTWNIGGDFSVGFSNQESTNQISIRNSDRSSFSVLPRVGYVFSDNWMLGLKTGYSFSKSDLELIDNGAFTGESEGTGESITVAPYVRRYFGLGNNLLINLQGELEYSASWSETISDTSERSTGQADQFAISIRPGITYFVSKNLAFESSFGVLQYGTYESEQSDGVDTKNSGFNLSLDSSNLFFGLSYYF